MSAIERYKEYINRQVPDKWYRFRLPSLNRLVGGKGVKGGRLIQVLGSKSTGKTTLAYNLLQETSQTEKILFVDFERTYDAEYARLLGINTDNIILLKTDTAEEGLQAAIDFVKEGIVLAVIIDSISNIVTESEIEKDLTESDKIGAAASLTTRWLKRIIPVLDNTGALCVVINQYRSNISTLSRKITKPYGALQLQYQTSLTIELTRVENKDDTAKIEAFVEKIKQTGKERSRVEFYLNHGKGFDLELDIINLAIEQEVIKKSGKWYYYGDLKANGIEQARSFPLQEIERLIHVE